MRKIFYVWFNNQDTADMAAEVVKDIVYAHGGVVGLAEVDNIEPDIWVLVMHMNIDIWTSNRISQLMDELENVISYRSERVD